MDDKLYNWVLSLPQMFAQFGEWLVTDLPYIHLAPLALFSVGGIAIIVTCSLIHLIIGG